MELSLSIAGLARVDGEPWTKGARGAIEWAASMGFRAITLDGTMPGIRARELDRSGRRDLAAMLRRLQLGFAGIDLWIPPEHLADATRSERALDALLGGIELAGDLAQLANTTRPSIGVVFPEGMPPAIRAAISTRADSAGAWVADYGSRATGGPPEDPIGVGIDPAAVLLSGGKPEAKVIEAGPGLRGARVSDASHVGRTVLNGPGARLDLQAYVAALAVAGLRGVVADLRGLHDPKRGAEAAWARWGAIASFGG